MREDHEGELISITITAKCPFCKEVVTVKNDERDCYGEDWWDGEMVIALADFECSKGHKFTVRL